MEDYVWPAVFLSVPIVSYYGYYYVKKRLDNYVVEQVMKKLNEITEEDEVTFKPLQKSQSALILFSHGGKQHQVCIPYDRTKSRNMLRKKVYLVRNEDKTGLTKTEITHKPGVPYLLSAQDMGGDKIVVEKDNNILIEYDKDEIPNYL